ncbi:unnamed protein product [Adineta steineri]|uniref:Uncharacterized protein n=1 Tax=Adineta steineri TaxID=433720 RepID=A0A814XBJ2_9BILA|nr:unnamed protein product [Adineta steineri]
MKELAETLKHPSKMYGLILINGVSRGINWFEGYETQTADPALLRALRRHSDENVNAKNVIKFLNSFLKRTSIITQRPNESNKNTNPPITLTCTIMHITRLSSPHKDDVSDTNDKCDPTKSSYFEFSNCSGTVLDEQAAKTAESIRSFPQGLDHISHKKNRTTVIMCFSPSSCRLQKERTNCSLISIRL